MADGRFRDIHDMFALIDDAKIALANRLYAMTRINPTQIAKFLHLKLHVPNRAFSNPH